jgi:hypothetical protein
MTFPAPVGTSTLLSVPTATAGRGLLSGILRNANVERSALPPGGFSSGSIPEGK